MLHAQQWHIIARTSARLSGFVLLWSGCKLSDSGAVQAIRPTTLQPADLLVHLEGMSASANSWEELPAGLGAEGGELRKSQHSCK